MNLFLLLLFLLPIHNLFIQPQTYGYTNITFYNAANTTLIIDAISPTPSTITIYNLSNYYEIENKSCHVCNSVYQKNTSGPEIILVNLTAGNYGAVMYSQTSPSAFYLYVSPKAKGEIIQTPGKFSFDLKNYSLINTLEWVLTDPQANVSLIKQDRTYWTYFRKQINNETNLCYKIFDQNATCSSTHSTNQTYGGLQANPGTYTLNISGVNGEALIYLNSTPILANPYRDLKSGIQAIGVASYGLFNYSGNLVPYTINTNTIYGLANITTIDIFSQNNTSPLAPKPASLQMNAELHIRLLNGGIRSYWLQNVAEFNTSDQSIFIDDEIWNTSSFYSQTVDLNKTLSGSGSSFGIDGGNTNYYGYELNATYYTTPLSLLLVTSIENKTNPVVRFGFEVIKNGNYTQPLTYYDNVTLNLTANSSSILVTPLYKSGHTDYYDSELVFGGNSNGSSTNFAALNASLGLWYLNRSMITAFPSVYSFGDTGEHTSDVNATIHNGYVYLTVANTSTLSLLSNNFNPPAPPLILPQNNDQYLIPLGAAILLVIISPIYWKKIRKPAIIHRT